MMPQISSIWNNVVGVEYIYRKYSSVKYEKLEYFCMKTIGAWQYSCQFFQNEEKNKMKSEKGRRMEHVFKPRIENFCMHHLNQMSWRKRINLLLMTNM